MKEKFKVLSVSAGRFKDDQTNEERVFASLNYLDRSVSDIIESDQIKVGQQHVKMRVLTDDNNALARKLANSGQIPGDVVLHLEMSVVKNTPSLTVIGFDTIEQRVLEPLSKK